MRRAALVLALACLACGAVIFGAPTQAATWPVPQRHNLAILVRSALAAQVASPAGQASRLTQRDMPLSVADAPAAQTGSQLRLAQTAFAPATINSNYDYVEASTDADQNWFRPNHSTSYATLGFVTGYYERADYQTTTCQPAATSVCFRYQGSAYASATAAVNAYTDGYNYTAKFATGAPKDCSTASMKCAVMGYGTSDGSVEAYTAIQINNCLAEIAATAAPASATANATMITQTVTNITAAAIQTMQTACTGSAAPAPSQTTVTQADFSIDSVSIHKNQSDSSTPIKKIKKGKTIYFFIDWTLRAIPTGDKPTYSYQATLKGQVRKHGSFAGTLSSYPPSSYVTYWQLKINKKGTYIFTGTVTIAGQSQKATTSFKVTA